jgi:hypothetical protein
MKTKLIWVFLVLGKISGGFMKKLRFAALLAVGFAAFGQDLYQIGDEGPAGGIIFYDKGTFSEGWRYLEAAPPETEWIAEWGAVGTNIVNTGIGIGSGKENTEMLAFAFTRLRDLGGAALTCSKMMYDGFNDWFLPSQGELNLMYKNLKRKGLGDFADEYYWSSTQYHHYAACAQNFTNGIQQNEWYKGVPSRVRAIRSF